MKEAYAIVASVIINILSLCWHVKAESVFKAPDLLSIIRADGNGEIIIDAKGNQIRVNCGSGIYEEADDGKMEVKDYNGVLDKEWCTFIERIPTRIIKLMPSERERYKDLLAQEYVENTYYFSGCGCDPTLNAEARPGRDRAFEYLYRLQAGSKRGVFIMDLGTNLYKEVKIPAGVTLGKYEKGDREKKKYYTYEQSYWTQAKTSIGPLGIGKPSLLAGQEYNTVLLSVYPPGAVTVEASCSSFPDDGSTLRRVEYQSKKCGDITMLFMKQMKSTTVGPREDLAELMPDELAMKLIEEVPKFIEVGWARKEVARSLVRDLERIAKAGTAKDAARIAGELAARTSKMREEECSIECRSIIGVNLEIMLKDLERWQERERLRAAGANR